MEGDSRPPARESRRQPRRATNGGPGGVARTQRGGWPRAASMRRGSPSRSPMRAPLARDRRRGIRPRRRLLPHHRVDARTSPWLRRFRQGRCRRYALQGCRGLATRDKGNRRRVPAQEAPETGAIIVTMRCFHPARNETSTDRKSVLVSRSPRLACASIAAEPPAGRDISAFSTRWRCGRCRRCTR